MVQQKKWLLIKKKIFLNMYKIMFGGKKKQVNVTTDMYIGQKLNIFKNLLKENKTVVSLSVLSAIYYVVSQYV